MKEYRQYNHAMKLRKQMKSTFWKLVQNLLQFLFCPFIEDFTQKIHFNAIKYVAL